ncbi:chymotrypsin-1-like [Sitophilus oryzae]|uniref:Chymotrypsin-1-like n=1 Tax=Sitophilus oryzae TaxID=7048 RepID=A0A6J2XHF7_SITOR|nr:chymotrypsin-1-like [Sitophilus oryzae]
MMNHYHFVVFLITVAIVCAVEAQDSPRIVNGTDAEEGEFPFAVSLRYKSRHTCGGTILNEKYILSAAHCVCNNQEPRNSSYYSIQYGLNKIFPEPINTINISKIYCNQFNSEALIYDSAVLELESPLPDNESWKPVKLAENFVTAEPQNGLIIGWGKTGHDKPISIVLQKLEVDIYDDETCGASMNNVHHICFGALSGGACNGDSGTALLVDDMQVGIASFITNKCGIATKKHPNVYSRVSTYYEWINNIIKEDSL